nr:hypothetical protein BaRGS_009289 [Batillaria attramentaria]
MAVLNPLLWSVSGETTDQIVGCTLNDKTSCPEDHCCVKQVITFKDPSKSAIVNTVCQPLLSDVSETYPYSV